MLFRRDDGRNDQCVAGPALAGYNHFLTRVFRGSLLIAQYPGLVTGLQCVLRIFGDGALPGAVRAYAPVVVNYTDECFLHGGSHREAGDCEEQGATFHPVSL